MSQLCIKDTSHLLKNKKFKFKFISYFYYHHSGGGTFDIAILSIDSLGMYHVRSTNGNTLLGGATFVDRLMQFCIDKLKDMMIDTEFSKEELSLIRTACKRAKTELSMKEETEIVISELKIPINVTEYNSIIAPYIDTTMACVKNALSDADLENDDITKIVLTGGGTYTPLVRSTLECFFKRSVCTDLNPMEAGKCQYSES